MQRWSGSIAAKGCLLGLPILVFALHSWFLGDWIVDDAGISFAYARNLAQGEGFVAQAGAEPVEGFSNLAWVLLMVPFCALGCFDPVWTPKAIAVVLVSFLFVLLYDTLLRRNRIRPFWCVLGLLLTALNPAFVIWCSSGLENALYALEVVGLFWVCCAFLRGEATGTRLAAIAACLVFLCGITRPDGLLYGAAFPALFALQWAGLARKGDRTFLGPLGVYFLVLIGLLGLLALFRLLVFGELVPNTYYAKPFPLPAHLAKAFLLDWEEPGLKVIKLFVSLFGRFVLWGILGCVALAGWLLGKGAFRPADLCLFSFAGLACLVYATLPRDWMGEHRFATPFYPMAYGALVLTLAKLEEWTRSRMTGLSARGAAVLLLFLGFLLAARTLDLGVTRTRHFLRHPTTPLSTVVGDVERFAELARRHGLQDFSVLSVDVGGLLWEDRFRVVDLGGLTDRKIADTFRYRRDLAAFHDHLFDRVRPTFLYAYGCWADAAMLQEDPRLERLYDRLEPPFAPWKENPSLQLFLLKPEYRTEPIS